MKLITTDLDGTLLNSNHGISHENILAILKAKEKGVKVVISTGRTYDSAKDILKNSNLDFPYIISCNGALIHNNLGEKVYSFSLDKTIANEIISFLYYQNYYFSVCTATKRYNLKNSRERLIADFYNAKATNPNLTRAALDDLLSLFDVELQSSKFVDTLDDFISLEEDILNICCVSFNDERLKFGKASLKDTAGISVFSSAFNNFEITHKDASKGAAMKYVSEKLNIPLSDTLAIGDNENDLSMLKVAGFSVAMGNSKDYIKKECSYVTLKNDDSGFAHAINYKLASL